MEYETALTVVVVMTGLVSLGKLGTMLSNFDSGYFSEDPTLGKGSEYYTGKTGVFLFWFFIVNPLYGISGLALMFLVAGFYGQL